MLHYLGILRETEIDQAIHAFSLESDIDFYPIFIFDNNDVGKNSEHPLSHIVTNQFKMRAWMT